MVGVIIKTGFQEIKHNINFSAAAFAKGKLLIESDHVIGVEETCKNGITSKIEARVIRQTVVTSTPYDVRLDVSLLFLSPKSYE